MPTVFTNAEVKHRRRCSVCEHRLTDPKHTETYNYEHPQFFDDPDDGIPIWLRGRQRWCHHEPASAANDASSVQWVSELGQCYQQRVPACVPDRGCWDSGDLDLEYLLR